jgi:hypothetical protein
MKVITIDQSPREMCLREIFITGSLKEGAPGTLVPAGYGSAAGCLCLILPADCGIH